jgi:Dynamin family/Sel1 repeat
VRTPTPGAGLCEAIGTLAIQLYALALAEDQDIEALAQLAKQTRDMPLTVAVLGPEGHGKSTLLNALVGTTVVPMSRTAACTVVPIWIRYSTEPQSTWQAMLADGQRIATSYEEFCQYVVGKTNPGNVKGVVAGLVDVYCALLRTGPQLVDLPGGGGVSLAMHDKLKAYFEEHAAAAVLVLKERGGYGTLNTLMHEIGLRGRAVAIVYNEESDDVQTDGEGDVRTNLARYLNLNDWGLTEEDIYIFSAKHLLNAVTKSGLAAWAEHVREAERLRQALQSLRAAHEDAFCKRLSDVLARPLARIQARLWGDSVAVPGQQLQAVAPLMGPSTREFLERVLQVLVPLGDEQDTQALDTIARGLSALALVLPRDQADPVAEARWKAEQGNAKAQNDLGVIYEQGRGIAQDYQQAVQWYRKAAEQGNAVAQCNLGRMYRQGRGVAQDEAQGVQWYRKAAEQGLVQAQRNLGWAYEYGRGVTQDVTQAVQWYRKAAEQGHQGAQDALAALELEANIRKILRRYPPCPGFWVPPVPGKERATFRDAIAKARKICQVKREERILGLICDPWGWSDDCLVFTNKALYFRDYWQFSGKEQERIPYSQFKKTVATRSFFNSITLPSGHKLNMWRSPTAIFNETLVSILNSIRQLVL